VRVTLTAADPATHERVDVLLDADEETSVAAVAEELATLLGRVRVAGRGARAVGGEAAVLRFPGAAPSSRSVESAAPDGLVEIRVVSGPGAGVVHRLGVGEHDIGGSPASAVPLADPQVPAQALTVEVDPDGTARVAPRAGVAAELEREPLLVTAPWPPRAQLAIAGTLLELATPTPADAAVEPSADGLDYNRPPRLLPPLRQTRFRLPPEPKEQERRPLPIIMAVVPLVMAVAMVLIFGRWYFIMFGLLSPISLIGSYYYDKRAGRQSHRRRLQDYRETKAAVEADATEALWLERTARRDDFPDPAVVLLTAVGPRRRLWERRRHDAADTADEIQRQASRLRALAAAEWWDAEAGREFSTEAEELADEMSKVHGRYATVGSQRRVWSSALAHAQDETRQALTQAQQAERDMAAHSGDLLAGVEEPTPEQRAAQRRQEDARDEAAGALQAARRRMEDAVGELDRVAGQVGDAIEEASEDDMKDGFWDKVKGVVSDIAPILRIIAKVASWVATAIAVVALVLAFTIGAPFALLLAGAIVTTISLLANTALAAAGEGSWWNVGIDLFSLVTFGLGAGAARVGAVAVKGAVGTAARAAASRARAQVLTQHRFSLGVARWAASTRLPLGPLRSLAGRHVTRVTTLADDAGRAAHSAVLTRPLPPVTTKELVLALDRVGARQLRHVRTLAAEFPTVAPYVPTVRNTLYLNALATGSGLVVDGASKVVEVAAERAPWRAVTRDLSSPGRARRG